MTNKPTIYLLPNYIYNVNDLNIVLDKLEKGISNFNLTDEDLEKQKESIENIKSIVSKFDEHNLVRKAQAEAINSQINEIWLLVKPFNKILNNLWNDLKKYSEFKHTFDENIQNGLKNKFSNLFFTFNINLYQDLLNNLNIFTIKYFDYEYLFITTENLPDFGIKLTNRFKTLLNQKQNYPEHNLKLNHYIFKSLLTLAIRNITSFDIDDTILRQIYSNSEIIPIIDDIDHIDLTPKEKNYCIFCNKIIDDKEINSYTINVCNKECIEKRHKDANETLMRIDKVKLEKTITEIQHSIRNYDSVNLSSNLFHLTNLLNVQNVLHPIKYPNKGNQYYKYEYTTKNFYIDETKNENKK